MLKLCLFQLRQRFRVGAFGTRRDIRPRRSADAPSLRVATPPRAPEHASARRGRATGASRDAARASSRRSAPRSFPPPPRVLLCSSALFHAAPRKTNASRAADAPRARRLTPTDANAGVLLARAGTLPTPRAPWPTRSTSPPSGCPSSPSPSRGAFAMPTRRAFPRPAVARATPRPPPTSSAASARSSVFTRWRTPKASSRGTGASPRRSRRASPGATAPRERSPMPNPEKTTPPP